MARSHKYETETGDSPGYNVYKLRTQRGWSQRQLADKCRPALDHTTVQRIEANSSYTSDSLDRIANALKVSVRDLFLPPEMLAYANLPPEVRTRIASNVEDAIEAYEARQVKQGKGRSDAG